MRKELADAIERLNRHGAGYDLAHTEHANVDSAAKAWQALTDALGRGVYDDNMYLSDTDYDDAKLDGEEYADFLDRAERHNNEQIDLLIDEVRARFDA